MKRYRWSYEPFGVTDVECDQKGYPHVDDDGYMQMDNTHFDTEREAWSRLLGETEAAIDLELRSIKNLKRQLEQRQLELVQASAKNSEARAAIRARWGDAS